MDENYIYGKNSVIEALESQTRQFNRILISNTSRNDEKIERIKELAKLSGIIFRILQPLQLQEHLPL